MLAGFKAFIMRGNVIELAVAFVMGTAFAAVVDGLVNGIINPLIAMVFGQPDLTALWAFEINNAQFLPGVFLNALLYFVLVAAAIYFFLVLPMNKLAERRARGQEPEPEELAADVALLTEIRDLLRAQQNR